MKKKILLIIIGIILVLFISLFLIFKIDKDSYFLGKWYYKYTYYDNDKLKYTEEDDMESYIKLNKNNTYEYGDYASDVVDKGIWFETKKGAYLVNEKLWLYKNKDNTLKTSLKDGKKVLFPRDYYHILIKKSK